MGVGTVVTKNLTVKPKYLKALSVTRLVTIFRHSKAI